MPAQEFDMEMDRGSTYALAMTLESDDNGVRAPKDLTGATIKASFKKNLNDVVAVFELTSTPADGITILDPATDGTIQLLIAPAKTEALTDKKLVYDIRVELSDGTVTFPVKGALAIIPTGTRA